MMRKDAFSRGFFFAFGAAVLALLLYLGWQLFRAALGISTPFIVGFAFALLLDPLVDRIQESGGKGRRLPSVILVFVGFLAVFVGLIAFIIPMLVTQTQSLVTWFTPTTYTVERSTARDHGFESVTSGLITSTYVAHDLTNGVNYYFKVLAVDSNGQKRQIGNVVQVKPNGAGAVTTTTIDAVPVATPSVMVGAPQPAPAASAAARASASPAAAGPDETPHATPHAANRAPLPPSGSGHPSGVLASPAPPERLPSPEAVPAAATPPAPVPSAPDGESNRPEKGSDPTPQPSASPESVGDAGEAPSVSSPAAWRLLDGDGAAHAAEPTPTPSASAAAEKGAGDESPLPLITRSSAAPASPHDTAATTVTRRVVTTTRITHPSPSPSPSPVAAGENPQPTDTRQLIAVPGDSVATLAWKAPTKGVSGIDSVRVQMDLWLTQHRKLGPFALPANFESIAAQYNDQLTRALKVTASRVGEIILASASGLLTVVLVPIVTFYVLADIDRLRGRLLYLLPDRARGVVETSALDVGNVFGSYVRGMLLVMLMYGLVSMLAFVGFLKSYALLLGVAAGILYAVPYIGALATALLAAILSLITGHGLPGTLLILGIQLALNQVFDNVVVPRVIGKSVGLHPLLTLFALLLGGGLFGLWGMLLSVPVAASIQQILFRLYPKLAAPTPLAMLMDRAEPVPPPGASPGAS